MSAENDDLAHEVAAVRAELARQQNEARSRILRGIVMIALIPVVFVAAAWAAVATGGVATVIALAVGAAYGLIGAVGGIAMIGGGGVEYRRFGKQLHDYDHVRHLPAARIVVRSR